MFSCEATNTHKFIVPRFKHEAMCQHYTFTQDHDSHLLAPPIQEGSGNQTRVSLVRGREHWIPNIVAHTHSAHAAFPVFLHLGIGKVLWNWPQLDLAAAKRS